MSRGCLNESLIAAGVISWNVTRRSFDAGTLMTSAMCQAMASPSRSRSVASQTWAAALASLRRRRTCFSESSGTTYSGRNVLRSTPIFDFGRSRIWPNDASTLYSLPSIRSSVLAFVGDSTTTRSCLPSANANPFAGNKKGPSGPPTRYFTLYGQPSLFRYRAFWPCRFFPPARNEPFFGLFSSKQVLPLLPPEAVDDLPDLLGAGPGGDQDGVGRVHQDQLVDADEGDQLARRP